MVAILEDDLVTEVFIERERQPGTVGNIYKGRVSKVLPGMQSAFVDIGLERDAFLYVSDVLGTPEGLDADDDDHEDSLHDEDSSERTPVNGSARRGRNQDRIQTAKIEDLLKANREVLVQVVKEPLGNKGARITSHATMPGRFLVFMPTVDHVGVSRKIESREERSRLRRIVREFREEHSFTGGVIIRTAATGRSEEDIVSDLAYFHRVWTDVQGRTESDPAPTVVYHEQSLVSKLLRDLLTKEFTAI